MITIITILYEERISSEETDYGIVNTIVINIIFMITIIIISYEERIPYEETDT